MFPLSTYPFSSSLICTNRWRPIIKYICFLLYSPILNHCRSPFLRESSLLVSVLFIKNKKKMIAFVQRSKIHTYVFIMHKNILLFGSMASCLFLSVYDLVAKVYNYRVDFLLLNISSVSLICLFIWSTALPFVPCCLWQLRHCLGNMYIINMTMVGRKCTCPK